MIGKISNVQFGQGNSQNKLRPSKTNVAFNGVVEYILRPRAVCRVRGIHHEPAIVKMNDTEGKVFTDYYAKRIQNGDYKVYPNRRKNPNAPIILGDGIITLINKKNGMQIRLTDSNASIDKTDSIEILSRGRKHLKTKSKTNAPTKTGNVLPGAVSKESENNKLTLFQHIKEILSKHRKNDKKVKIEPNIAKQVEIDKTNRFTPLQDKIVITKDDYNTAEFDALRKAIIETNINYQLKLSTSILKQVVANKFGFKNSKLINPRLPESEINKPFNLKHFFESSDGRGIILEDDSAILISRKGKVVKLSVRSAKDETLKANIIQLIKNLEKRIIPPSESIPA